MERIGSDGLIDVLAVVSTGTVLVLWLSPVPTMRRVMKEKTVGNFSSFPYVSTVANTFVWSSYGIFTPDRAAVIYGNVSGLVLSLIYCKIFFVYSENRKATLKFYFLCSFLVSLVFLVAWGLNAIIDSELDFIGWVGKLAALVNIVMLASPLSVLLVVIRLKNSDPMPFWMCLAVLMNSVMWSSWAVAVGDINVLVPNASGVLLGLFQMLLFVKYPPRHIASRRESIEVEIASPSDHENAKIGGGEEKKEKIEREDDTDAKENTSVV